jgi:hypothetical protein
MPKYNFQVVLVLNLGNSTEEHTLAPCVLTEEEINTKIDSYKDYGEKSYFEGQCIDNGGNYYSITVNEFLLQRSYFKFLYLGKANEE